MSNNNYAKLVRFGLTLNRRRYIQEKLNKTSRIDLSELANGAYLYRINKEGKLLKTGKLILNR